MNQIPGNRPVAFRMPCCDSQNTPSPRFWTEIFNKTTPQGNFLSIDSSVFNIYTGNGHYDGETRWNNFTANWQQIQNFVDIHVWNYDIRDPYVGAPYFGDPR